MDLASFGQFYVHPDTLTKIFKSLEHEYIQNVSNEHKRGSYYSINYKKSP